MNRLSSPFSGIMLIDKPAGWTSFDVVAKVRGLIERHARQGGGERRRIKVGHTGTLDPSATGLLVLAVGAATKQIQTLTKLDKVYEVEACLGATSTTGDGEGDIRSVSFEARPGDTDVRSTMKTFLGTMAQVPPTYSAIKVNGIRAYKLARKGVDVQLEPRSVTVYAINDITYEWPKLHFTVHVSSGTYIRSLVEDIGKKLGCGAYMSGLRRTRVGIFDIKDAASMTKDMLAEDVLSRLHEIE